METLKLFSVSDFKHLQTCKLSAVFWLFLINYAVKSIPSVLKESNTLDLLTLNWTLDQYSIDILIDTSLVDTWSTVSRLNQKLVGPRLRCQWSVDRVSTEVCMSIEYQSRVDQGDRWRVLFDGIDWLSNTDAVSLHMIRQIGIIYRHHYLEFYNFCFVNDT